MSVLQRVKRIAFSRLGNFYSFLRLSPGMRIFLFLFLLPVFFVLHGYNENFGLIPFSVILALLIRYFILSFIVTAINLVWFRSKEKAFVFSFYLLAWYFFFGAFYDLLKDIFPGSRIYSYSFLLPFILVISCVVYWILNKQKIKPVKLTKYISLLISVLFIFDLLVFGYYQLTNKGKENDLSGSFSIPKTTVTNCSGKEYPDIYFIVFDGYTSSKLLAEEFQYKNETIDSLLLAHHYYTSYSSKSNYNFTAFSLASTFDLDYLKSYASKGYINPKRVMQAVNTMEDNNLVCFLKNSGYEFKNFGRFQMRYMYSKEVAFFDFYYKDLIDKQTLYARIMRDIGWHFSIKNIFTGKPRIPQGFAEEKKEHIERNKRNYEQLITEFNGKSSKPKFVYAHIMLPHEPFYMKEDGTVISDSNALFGAQDLRKGYLDQLKYTNKLIENIIIASDKNLNRGRVVIIEGDHGYRFYDDNSLYKEFPNLNTYYFSDHDYRLLYDSISPVNSFRVILNKYFCYNLPLLEDTSYYLHKTPQ